MADTKKKPSPLDQLPHRTPSAPVPPPPVREEKPAEPPKKEKPATNHAEGRRYHFAPPFWTIASILSLSINLVLIIALLAMWTNIQRLSQSIGGAMNMGNYLLGGLYTNFEMMDRAHITTNIPVQTEIPVKFDLQLNQETNVVLSRNVTISNAYVTVRTESMNITNALATIVLPQGTNLPVTLTLTVPVDKMVPVTLNVPVDIPLKDTQLHDPFVGLQDVVKPFYCLLNPAALNQDNQPVCP